MEAGRMESFPRAGHLRITPEVVDGYGLVEDLMSRGIVGHSLTRRRWRYLQGAECIVVTECARFLGVAAYQRVEGDVRVVHEFLVHDFPHLSGHFVPIPGARETLELARRLDYRVVLATNPVWPLDAVRTRLRAGGLDDFTFDFISHSEVMTCCKPDPRYYRELLERLQARGEECLMIGNDPRKDLPAKEAAINTFLIGNHPPDPRMDACGTLQDLRSGIARERETSWLVNRRSFV